MAESKKYYWLKLKEDFFNQKEMKKLRKIAGGDTFTIIYLKMQLLSLRNEGKLFFDGIDDSFAEEIALEIDEDPDNVSITLSFLEKCGFIEMVNDKQLILTDTFNNLGSETESAERVRKHRESIKLLQCNASVTNCNENVQKCNTDIEIDIEKELDIELDLDKEIKQKKEKNISVEKNKFSDDSDEISISEYLLLKIKNNNENFKQPNMQSWATHVDKMIRIDNRSLNDIRLVIDFATSDTFWQGNILSTDKLRKQFDQLMIKAKQPVRITQEMSSKERIASKIQSSVVQDFLRSKGEL